MSAVIGQDWRPKTHKELWVQYQYYLLESWNHTVYIGSSFGGTKKSFESLHPYLSSNASHTSIAIKPQRLFDIPEERDGERISIIREMCNATPT